MNDFEEIKERLKKELDKCKTKENFRVFLHGIMEVIAFDYRNLMIENKMNKILEKINKEEEDNEKM